MVPGPSAYINQVAWDLIRIETFTLKSSFCYFCSVRRRKHISASQISIFTNFNQLIKKCFHLISNLSLSLFHTHEHAHTLPGSYKSRSLKIQTGSDNQNLSDVFALCSHVIIISLAHMEPCAKHSFHGQRAV